MHAGTEDIFFERVAMAFPKDSPWLKHFDKHIKKIVQGGLIQRWKQVFWPPDDECSLGSRGGVGTTAVVTVTDMQGSFFILMIGKEKKFIHGYQFLHLWNDC